jgi:cytochrome c oxidase assembly factor CtaG
MQVTSNWSTHFHFYFYPAVVNKLYGNSSWDDLMRDTVDTQLVCAHPPVCVSWHHLSMYSTATAMPGNI